jgi:HD-like signal output (HDOD) protein
MTTVEDIVDDISAMVSIPAVAIKVCELADDPRASIAELSGVIAQDTALAARMLRVANSAALGMAGKVDTISRAATVLGVRAVRDLALGVSAVHSFDGIPVELITMESFWIHGLLCAAAARELGDHCVRTADAESTFVAGLLHDVGQLTLLKRMPREMRQALLMLADDPNDLLTLHQCEQRILGFTHCEVGAALARHWQLPPALQACIEFHHEPSRATEYRFEVAIVHIANSVATLAEIDSRELADADPIDANAWTLTGLNPARIPEWVPIVQDQLAEMRSFLQ